MVSTNFPLRVILHINTPKSKIEKKEKIQKKIQNNAKKHSNKNDDKILDELIKNQENEAKKKKLEERNQVKTILTSSLKIKASKRLVEALTERTNNFKKDVEQKIWTELNRQVADHIKMKMPKHIDRDTVYQESLKDYMGDIFLARVKYFDSLGIFDSFDPFIMISLQRNVESDKLPSINGYVRIEDLYETKLIPKEMVNENPFENVAAFKNAKKLCHVVFYSYYSGFNLCSTFYKSKDGSIGYQWIEFIRTD